MAIPPQATITLAYIQFQVDDTTTEVTTLNIAGHTTDNAATFTTVKYDISDRPVTSATVSWSPPPWTAVGEAGPAQQTPDLTAVVQEIVDRPGWASGNALAFIITGNGRRVAESFDGLADGAPLLHVEYSGGVPPTYRQFTAWGHLNCALQCRLWGHAGNCDLHNYGVAILQYKWESD